MEIPWAGSIPATRYRAKIDFVSPPTRRDTFELERECFLGVSLENRNFEPARFHSLLEWVSRRFTKCKILVGDGIHRLTLESRTRMPATEARDRALRLGREFMRENRDILALYRSITQFEFITCSEIQQTSEYSAHHQAISDYFLDTPEFRESVERFGLRYHRGDRNTLSEAEQNYRLNISSSYFIEEFSVFACLVNRGITVMVYPGSFSTLAEIADNRFPGVSKALESLCVVSLHFKKR
ncbi:tRNA-dependent cyclodipeptide synthase [Paraburkholderia humisilvae]|nr:tRNA-dependent cyclodipeptide synthase [Paraburkholderia humisilvae]